MTASNTGRSVIIWLYVTASCVPAIKSLYWLVFVFLDGLTSSMADALYTGGMIEVITNARTAARSVTPLISHHQWRAAASIRLNSIKFGSAIVSTGKAE